MNPYGIDDPRRIERAKGWLPFFAVIAVLCVIALVKGVTGI
jgi:hypothetical protein